MRFKVVYSLLILAVFFSCQQKPSSTEIATIIESTVRETDIDSILQAAYQGNDYKPIWVESRGLKNAGENYFEALEEIKYDGLEKEDYKTKELADLLSKIKESEDPAIHAELDILITQSFLSLASDLNIGRVDPATINIEWKLDRKEPTLNYQEVLLSLADGASLQKVLDELRPSNIKYAELRSMLEHVLSLPLEEGKILSSFEGKIEKGDQHEAIPVIREKLLLSGDLQAKPQSDQITYDEELFVAVKAFQKRHGLIDDGVIGADFLAAINYSPSDLISKIKVNMERLRWLPDFNDEVSQVIVNIPDFHLYYIQQGDTIFTSKVVVGKDYRQTPVFKSKMTYLVFSPTWTLPETILWEDAIPSIKNDEGYLADNNMKVLDLQEKEVNYKKINWRKLENKEDFPYLIRQAPGSSNPLGKVKFMFPNEHYIYIHDSPAQALFSQDERTFSSGCIRMEKPTEFAALLLRDAEDWDEGKILEAMTLDEEKKVDLPEPQDVWILYLSIWGKEGNIEIREDVYDMDKKLAEALSLPLSEYFL
jgi:murein L,D-transpeptidase YcbB/YkuD